MKYYCGIGSRKTPKETLEKMRKISSFLSLQGFVLNSGDAKGADSAFEEGCLFKQRRIYLPKDGFEGKYGNGKEYIVPLYNEKMIRKYHPKFSSLSENGRLLMSRNSYQVLGEGLDNPVEFVVCWTEDGLLQGGTAQALRIAKDYDIPIFNLFFEDSYDNMMDYLSYKGYIYV